MRFTETYRERMLSGMSDKARVFISWSGDLSKEIALLVADQIEDMFDVVKPWVSDKNIALGQKNIGVIFDELQNATAGIFLLTRQTQSAPWINFEAGALSMTSDNGERAVIPVLIDFEMREFEGPLRNFQGRKLDESGWTDVVKTLAALSGVKENVAMKRMETGKSNFLDQVQAAVRKHRGSGMGKPAHAPGEMFEKILDRVEEIRAEMKTLGTGIKYQENGQRNASLEMFAGTLARAILGEDTQVAILFLDGCYTKNPETVALIRVEDGYPEEQAAELERHLKDLGVDAVRFGDFDYEEDLDWS